jgi:hypothetical protein
VTEAPAVVTEAPAPVPVTEAPAPVPVPEAPVVEAPVTEAPVTEAPVPMTEAPVPATEAPAPVVEVPAPMTEAPSPSPIINIDTKPSVTFSQEHIMFDSDTLENNEIQDFPFAEAENRDELDSLLIMDEILPMDSDEILS